MMINFIQVRLDESLKKLESRSRVRQSKLDTIKTQIEEMTGVAKDYLTEQVEIERRAAASKGVRGKSPLNKGAGARDAGTGQDSGVSEGLASKSNLLEELTALQSRLQTVKPPKLEVCPFPPASEMPADPVDQPSPAPLGFANNSDWNQDSPEGKPSTFGPAEPAVPVPAPVKKITRTIAIQTTEPEVKYQQTRKTVVTYLESRYAPTGCCIQCRNCREVIDLVRYAELETAESAKRNENRQKEPFLRLSTPKKQKPDVTVGNKENEALANTSVLSEQKSTNSTTAKSNAPVGQEKTKEIERRRLELLLILDEVGGLTRSQMSAKKSAFDILDDDASPNPTPNEPFNDLPQFGGASAKLDAPSFAKPKSRSNSKVGSKVGSKIGKQSATPSAKASKKGNDTPTKGASAHKVPDSPKVKPKGPSGRAAAANSPKSTAKKGLAAPKASELNKPQSARSPVKSTPTSPKPRGSPNLAKNGPVKTAPTQPAKPPEPAAVPTANSTHNISSKSSMKGMSLASFGMPGPARK